MSDQFRERISQALYNRSCSPRSDDNSLDSDWQAGFMVGLLTEEDYELWEDKHPITVEWRRRGCPTKQTKEFKSWKAGYHAGVFKKIMSK